MAPTDANSVSHILARQVTWQVTRDGSAMRQKERDSLETQLLEPARGGLTQDEIDLCIAAFSKMKKLETTYNGIWEEKNARLRALEVMATA